MPQSANNATRWMPGTGGIDWPGPQQWRMPPERLGFARGAIDRATHLRDDAARLAADEAARFYIIAGEQIVLTDAGAPLFPLAALPEEAHRRETVFLGFSPEGPRLAVLIEQEAAEALARQGRHRLEGLRALAMQAALAPDILADLATAKALTAWHMRHRFCANCGAGTTPSHGGWRRDCAACRAQHFPRTDPVVIMLVTDGERCLLGRQPRFMPNMVSCLAGFVEPGETLEDAVRREVKEEAGIHTGAVSIVANQPWPFPMSLMIGAYAEALDDAIVIDAEELEWARWFSRDEVRTMLGGGHPEGLQCPAPMAIAHTLIRAWVES